MDCVNKIALVEDNKPVRRSLEKMLEHFGYEVVGFDSAEQFLDSSDVESLNCIILDMRLHGMNGFQLLKQLRSTGNQIPVLLISGNFETEVFEYTRTDDHSECLCKPFKPSDLLNVVQQILETSRLSTEMANAFAANLG